MSRYLPIILISFCCGSVTRLRNIYSGDSVEKLHRDVGIEIAAYEITERQTKSVNGVRGMVGKIKAFSLPIEYQRFTSNETARQ